jgi:hypothetical protein
VHQHLEDEKNSSEFFDMPRVIRPDAEDHPVFDRPFRVLRSRIKEVVNATM